MKTDDNTPETAPDDEMLTEYDFSGMQGVRGKYYQRYRRGHTVRVRHGDGSTKVRHFKLEDGAVLLDPDVRAYFPDSEAVNRALRTLIEIVPRSSPATATSKV